MKVLVGIAHSAHVHFFKNFLAEASENGISTGVFVREPGLATDLLDTYDINYDVMLPKGGFSDMKIVNQLKYEWRTWRKVRDCEPDIITGIGGITGAHVSAISDTKSLVFTDTEHATVNNTFGFPFADCICTPDCFTYEIGKKQVNYPGYHELAYLHPNRFEPDPSVLDQAGISTDDCFVILRTVDWQALHDIGDSGFDDIVDVVIQLEATGAEVLITAEGELPDAVSHCQLDIEPHRIHDLMAYANLFVGESATMASESAVLGTPAVFVSSSRRGYTDELEDRYGLVFNFSDEDRHQAGLEKAIEILEDDKAEQWDQRRERLLEDKIDTTEFIVEQIQDLANGE